MKPFSRIAHVTSLRSIRWVGGLVLALVLTGRAFAEDPAPVAMAATNDSSAGLISGTLAESTAGIFTNLTSEVIKADLQQPEAVTPDSAGAPELGELPTPGVAAKPTAAQVDQARQFQLRLDFARKQRGEKDNSQAGKSLIALLQTNAPAELKRPVLFELALVAQDENQFVKAEQIFTQYLQLYPDDPSAPEVLLRQGLIYRQMGVNSLAISKFYAVMSTALKLKLERMDYYKKLVLQAQIEIADTYYLEGKYVEASDYFARLLKNAPPDLDQAQIEFKLIRSLSCLTNHAETVARAQVFLQIHPASTDVPEVRFLVASALKKLGRNQDSLKQVLQLLQSQRENVQKNPETWAYWQRRAGNEIASQLFKEGDALDALEIYLSLADLDHAPDWQLPVWYQTALVYEQLQQWPKAVELYDRILGRQKELADPAANPSLLSLFQMAGWRKDYLAWLEKAKTTDQTVPAQRGDPPSGGRGGALSSPAEISRDLKQHLALCQEIFAIVEREGSMLRDPAKPALFEFLPLKKNLLPRLNESLDTIRKHRVNWHRLAMDERARHPEIGMLLRQNQDLIMKIILLDRENEQTLLRRGLVPPRELPSVNRQRPHFVADLYRRQGLP